MKNKKDNNQLDELRHSCAHLLAAAVLELWPGTKNAIGPAIENGFYQDFDFGDVKISEDDFPKIEKKMHQLAQKWGVFEEKEVSLEEVRKDFAHNPYKLELAEEFAKEGKKLTENNPGNFLDLCKGGHISDPKNELKHFKLLSIAGAYWRGSEKNKMLTRIYGTVWPTKEEFDKYIWQLEEAKKRDHKKIGGELELFFISNMIGPGLPIYMPKGETLRRILTEWITQEKEKRAYQFVWTPHIAKSELYKQSGHWQKYEAMMSPMEIEDDEYVVKPMNCPHHFQVYLQKPRSYRELPLRIAENATVYRYEKSGELNGLFRVRALTQDDTHTFVMHDQIGNEINQILDLAFMVYKTFDFTQFRARVSTRDQDSPQKYLGDPKLWDKAEDALVSAVKKAGIDYFIGEGEAAFYGPKIDMLVKDALGREWQLTTVQLDFVQPKNFDLAYVNENGKREFAAVLHIAILGSIDRFLAVLLEHFAGNFPVWLAPVQAVVLPITDRNQDYAQAVVSRLKSVDIRTELDDRSETLQAKIRDAQVQKIPYMVIVGDKEKENKTVSIRLRTGEDLGGVKLDEFIGRVQKNIADKHGL